MTFTAGCDDHSVTASVSIPASVSEATPEVVTDELHEATHCLFCTHTDHDLEHNLSHMRRAHGFVVPSLNNLATDLESLITYLGLVIDVYHTCLFCGHEKYSREAVRAHMLSKGHCQLDLAEGSEFLDFWASNENQADEKLQRRIPLLSSDTEFQLPSGTIAISKRTTCRPSAKHFPIRAKSPDRTHLGSGTNSSSRTSRYSCSDLTSSSSSLSSSGKDQIERVLLAPRDAAGVVGLSSGQRRTLAVAHRRAKTSEDRATNKARWTLEKMGNSVKQKHFKVGTTACS